MAVASSGERLYFFGGVGAAGTESFLDISNDLWAFAPARREWVRLDAAADAWPGPRRCCGFTPSADRILCWGGSGTMPTSTGVTHTFLNDLWSFSPASGHWEQLEGSDDFRVSPQPSALRPEPRYTPIFHSVGAEAVLFGGYTEDRLGRRKMNDLWIYSEPMSQWRRIDQHGAEGYAIGAEWPGIRYGAMSAADQHTVYICGGFADDGDHIDVWAWEHDTGRWTMLAPEATGAQGPRPRYCAAFVHHERGLWMCGGRSRRYPKDNFSDTWRFDLDRRRWELVEEAASTHQYGADAVHIGYHAKASSTLHHGAWYLWGGEGRQGHVSDLWCFDFSTTRWSQLAPARSDDPIFW